MKNITILLSFIFAFNSWAVAPYGIKGQAQSGTLYSNVHQFPNNQVTNAGGINALVETGNKNLLINPSFEHTLFSTGWTFSGSSTFFEDDARNIDGKKTGGILAVNSSFALIQDSTLYATQFADGIQGLVSVRVKANNNATGIKVCSRSSGVTSTTNCVDVVANNKWGLYKVPVILGGISNGISIASTGNTTSSLFVEDAFVGAVDLSATQSFDTTCDTRECATQLTARLSSNTVSTLDNPGWISCSASGNYASCDFAVGTFTVTPSCQVSTLLNSNNTLAPKVLTISSTAITVMASNNANASFNVGSYFISCNKQGVDYTSAITARKNYEKMTVSSFSSTNADTDWASCGHTTSDFTGFGTVTSIETQCKREGSDLLMRGKFTSGADSAVEARLNLKLGGSALTSASSPTIGSLQVAGHGNVSTASTTFFSGISILIEPSVGYVTFGRESSTTDGITKTNANNIATSGRVISINARIPISGWTNSNIIIGQFNGLESCANTLECTDTFSAKVSGAGVVSAENIDWINGNCAVSSNRRTCTFTSGIFTVAPNCTMTPSSNNGAEIRISSSSSSSVAVDTYLNGVGSSDDFNIICQKQGADYVAKSAKAVSSDQNVRSIGSTNVDMQSVYFGSGSDCASLCTAGNCTICSQVGTKITSVSFQATGAYALNGINGLKYVCVPSSANGQITGHDRANSTSSLARIYSRTSSGTLTNAGAVSVTCTGIP